MKKIILSVMFAIFVFAEGFVGAKSGQNLMSVKEALNLNDDQMVTLRGFIIKELKDEHYEFIDENGDKIEIEIDRKIWNGISVNEKTLIEIYGEIDKELLQKAKIEVKSVKIVR